MSCKDCIHEDVCKIRHFPSMFGLTGDGCPDFKNKADVVEVSKAAEILDDAFGNDYPCNFNNIDEWLPYLCEYANTCDCSSVKCWEQLIKHYDERRCG